MRASHLLAGTSGDNTLDMMQKGRDRHGECRGEASGMSKLTEKSVSEIRRMCASGQSQSSVGKLFGVAQTTVSGIVHRKTWKHI